MSYKLSAVLAGHDDDVKAVSYPSPRAVITGSRDGTVRVWNLLSDNPPTYDEKISSQSSQFVNTVAYLPESGHFKEGLIISGGKETVIEVREPSKIPSENAERLLLGHGGNICTLDVDPDGKYIVSGSWDCEARIWPVGKWECETVLRPHEAAVWGVLAYDRETVITASADKLIRIWHISGKLIRTLKGSTDVARALCRVQNHPTGADFASAGNDAVIRLWTIQGEMLAELHGHENYIYSLVCTPSGELVSSSEDRTARVWKGLDCVQTITHPAISVWSVAVCAGNGDIVTGASDRIARVFTRDPARFADEQTIREFDEGVTNSAIPQQQMGDINKENLPGPEFLTQKSGTKDGQVQLIKANGGQITAHVWDSIEGKWNSAGTVVDAAGSGQKVDYNGQKYDYVFDVDIEDGKPALKLPFNVTQNPYDAATKFLENNKLPMTYLEAVANHIVANTNGAVLGDQVGGTASGPGSDPWGSDQRYRPGGEPTPEPARPVQAKTLPQTDYLSILVSSLPKLQKKVKELNQGYGSEDFTLSSAELTTLDSLCKSLEAKPPKSVLGGLELVVKICTTWPYADRMPGLDALRLLTNFPETASYPDIVNIIITSATESSPAAENHVMMAIRAFVNLFQSEAGRRLAASHFAEINQLVKSAIVGTTNRNLLSAAATLYINYAVLGQETIMSEVVGGAITILNTQKDSEAVFRALVAVGTAVSKTKGVAPGVETPINLAEKNVKEPRIRNLVAEIKTLL